MLVAWTVLTTLPFFLIMKCANLLRVPLIFEVIGMDIAETGTNVYIENLVAQAIYRAHQHKIKSKRYEELRRQEESNGKTKDSSGQVLQYEPEGSIGQNSQRSIAVDINRLNMEIESER